MTKLDRRKSVKSKSPSTMEQDRAQVVASGFLTLLASQIGTRVVTFCINLLIARHLTPEAYGLASVQFHLLTTTALFISREGFRRGCLRFGGTTTGTTGSANSSRATPLDRPGEGKSEAARGDGAGEAGAAADSRAGGPGSGVDSRSVLRVASLVIPLGLVVTSGVCGVALWRHGSGGGESPDADVPYYREAVVLHGVAAVLELLAEPFYILASVNLMFGYRVAVEFASTLTKSLVTLGLLSQRQLAATLAPALLFSVAQMALAAVVLAGYFAVGFELLGRSNRGAARKGGKGSGGEDDKGPQGGGDDGKAAERADSNAQGGGRAGVRGWFAPWSPLERQVLGTSAIFTLQAVEKLALAEGSKVVLATMQSAMNQGVYGLVSNLGSLVVRTLFQPLEEAAFAAFSTWGAEASSAATGPTDNLKHSAAAAAPAAVGGGGDAAADVPSGARLAPLARALAPMVKGVTVLGLLAAAFGPSYSYVLLRLVYGLRWSETEAPAVLAAYSVYVLLLAVNGIGEAFAHAVLDARGLQQSNALLLLFSGAHLAACVALIRRYGAIGLVAADGANMVLRITFSAWCIRRFFRPLAAFSLRRDLLPAPATLAAFVFAAAAAAASNRVLLVGPGTDASTPHRVFLRRAVLHVGVGASLLAVVLGLVARTERSALGQVVEMRRRRRGGDGGGGGAADVSKED